MKLECEKKHLLEALSIVGHVIPTRTPKDVLYGVKIAPTDGGIVVEGSNMETSARIKVNADRTGEAVALPNYGRFRAIVAEMGDEITLECSPGKTRILSGRSDFTLPDIGTPEEFPGIAPAPQEASITTNAGALSRAMTNVSAFCGASLQYAFGAIHFDDTDRSGDRLTLAATDTRALGVATLEARFDGGFREQVLVQSGAVRPLVAMLDRIAGDATLRVSRSLVSVSDGESFVTARQAEGRFPRWREIVPRYESSVDLPCGPLTSAVRQVMLIASEESIYVTLSFSDGLLTVGKDFNQIGSGKVEIPVSWSGKPLDISFSPKLLLTFLKQCPAEAMLTMSLRDTESAAAFDHEQYRFILMPFSQERT